MDYLRDLRDEDRDLMLRWRNAPQIAQYMFRDAPISPEEHARWFARVRHSPDCRYWIIHRGGLDAGAANLAEIDEVHRRSSLGIYLAPERQGRGLGFLALRELLEHAFAVLQLERVSCEVLASNVRMQALARRLGFIEEGRLRAYVRKAGQPCDVVCLGLLRAEWLAGRQGWERSAQDLAARFVSDDSKLGNS